MAEAKRKIRRLTVSKIDKILERHELWLLGDKQGEQADLSYVYLVNANLSDAEFQRANLAGAVLWRANLSGAKLRKADLNDAKLQTANLSGANLSGAKLQRANLSGAKLLKANLSDAKLWEADLSDAELQRANLSGAVLWRANLRGAKLQEANLNDAKLRKANLSGADLQRANLSGADLRGADLNCGAVLRGADLTGVNLWEADLTGADFSRANFESADVTGVTYDHKGNRWGIRKGEFAGVRVDTCYGSQKFKRFAQDQCFLEEFKKDHPTWYWIWFIFADCGRSFMRWTLWSVLFACLFGLIFYELGPGVFEPTKLWWCSFTMLYYSVVTFTTLGFGDVVPTTLWGAFWVGIEVILGYVMLGGLISIFANKMARRS